MKKQTTTKKRCINKKTLVPKGVAFVRSWGCNFVTRLVFVTPCIAGVYYIANTQVMNHTLFRFFKHSTVAETLFLGTKKSIPKNNSKHYHRYDLIKIKLILLHLSPTQRTEKKITAVLHLTFRIIG